MRITDMITQDEYAWYFINFSPLLLWEMSGGNKWEFKFWSYGFKAFAVNLILNLILINVSKVMAKSAKEKKMF